MLTQMHMNQMSFMLFSLEKANMDIFNNFCPFV